jgi:tetratricopeptide (TPR) repeat protein
VKAAPFYLALLTFGLVIGEARAESVFGASIRGDNTEATCLSCHSDVVQAWRGSDHARAMEHASVVTVLGDFKDILLSHSGETTRLSQRGNTFHATVSPSGEQAATVTYHVLYTFGVTPLQQYLVETEGGRLQALPWAWDTRDASEGGQRWFHLYEEDNVPPGNRLHWREPLQNWNGMCADCHSTGLERGYDLETNTFKTTATTLNVSCASCHGEAETHVEAMKNERDAPVLDGSFGDLIRFVDRSESRFERRDGETTAVNRGASHASQEFGVCSSCHARRAPLTAGIDPARAFLDQFTPELLNEGLYYADGQIRGEVYVQGSFAQSKMAAAGVTCSHCHDAHSLKLKAEGNGLCATCHAPEVFDTSAHHHHERASAGAACTSCHMPQTTYMGVDARRDHSFKVPRPDLSSKIGTPNACTGCHTDMEDEIAAQHIVDWYGPDRAASFAETFHAARARNPAARAPLAALITNEEIPVVVRATGLALISGVASPALIALATTTLSSSEPLLRLGAIRALAQQTAQTRARLLAPLLNDKIKAVRLEAATALTDVSPTLLAPDHAARLNSTMAELLVANEEIAWRGEGALNRGLIYQDHGDLNQAAAAYRRALKIDPAFAPPAVNLSELLRADGKEDVAIALLEAALVSTSGDASVHHALGLALIRTGHHAEALAHLEAAADGAPQATRFSFVLAVALDSLGRRPEAGRRLAEALKRHPYDPDLLVLGLSFASRTGETDVMRHFAQELAAIFPQDPSYKDLLSRLQRQ